MAGKRKAQEKKADIPALDTICVARSDLLVECWDIEHQSIDLVAETVVKQTYKAKAPLLPWASKEKCSNLIFPLCPDHLITLLQFNAVRGLAMNRTLISGILTTPLDCESEIIHVLPLPTELNRLPLTLLPTILQQTVPHGDWIDMFPCPEGRDRLIRATGLFDEDDLWADCVGGLFEGFPDDEVERRGMIAWSPPWDITGWEMSEGFLRKWGWLFEGLPEILEATNRWRNKRGEEPLFGLPPLAAPILC